MLSALGLVTQVPRQEDIGFDMICNIADQESGVLSFRHHYAVSVKSTADDARFVFEPPDSRKGDATYAKHYDWMFNFELPLLLALVDRDKQEVALFSTLPAWFLHYGHKADCGVIELLPRQSTTGENAQVGPPKDCGPDARAAGRKRYEVDLGPPITVIKATDLNDKARLALIKEQLRPAIELGAQTARHAQMHIPVMWWPLRIHPTGGIMEVGIQVGTPVIDNDTFVRMLTNLAPGLLTTSFLLKWHRPDLLPQLKAVMRLLPPAAIPQQFRDGLPEIFKD
jgi:hypothetical protein